MFRINIFAGILKYLGKAYALVREKGIGFVINSIPPEFKERFVRASLLFALGYVAAQVFSGAILGFLVNPASLGQGLPREYTQVERDIATINHGAIKKSIVERNLFNVEGKLPQERDIDLDANSGGIFDPNGPCEVTTLPIALVGTIMMGKDNSLATIRQNEYSEADIYKAGDVVIGFPNALVHEVSRKRVVINNEGRKECLEIDPDPTARLGGNGGSGMMIGGTDKPISGGSVTLESSWVEKELGEGFSKVLQAARFVPNTQPDGSMNGFKVFAIDPQTIMAKIGLQNDDVITKVNDVNMKQPDQGFALYQSLQDEREITIHVMRRGNIPATLNVKIK